MPVSAEVDEGAASGLPGAIRDLARVSVRIEAFCSITPASTVACPLAAI